MRRFTIMGFTEAELGFVLAALFSAVAITAVHERDASALDAEQLRDDVAVVDSIQLVNERLAAANANMADSIRLLNEKISTKVPQCWEKGESSAPIADVAVVGANRYRMNGDIVTIDEIRVHLASFIARGDSLGCRFIVRARPTAGVNALQQSAAVWGLRKHFDVNDRPR